MGMFDWVNYEANCPKCGNLVDGWQTKMAGCTLELIEPWQTTNFHARCDNCGAWIEAKVDAEVEHIVKKCDVTLEVVERKLKI